MKKDLTGSVDSIIFNYISSSIERGHTGKGKPWAMVNHDRPLTNRQQRLLDALPYTGSRVVVKKSGVSMPDLAAMTLETGDEFAMFTLGPKRLIVRGDWCHVDISPTDADELDAQGYRWSGHTHTYGLAASAGDQAVLGMFPQTKSVIYNGMGKRGMVHNANYESIRRRYD